jgi:antitoxin (DNA-binding transcriptional repressor) of toxin-antitoxin stability system
VRECLERGEPVEIERDGQIVARVEPCAEPRFKTWKEYVEARKSDPPLDDEFERDLAIAREMLNTPVETEPWE